MTTDIPYFEETGVDKPQPEKPTVERNVVHVVVFDPKTNRVLGLTWPKFNWQTFVIGGIEGDEDPILAAQREVLEETGYKNLKFINELGKTKAAFYAAHKNENRVANATGLLFELVADERAEVKESETTNHSFSWIPKDEVAAFISIDPQKYTWSKALEVLNQRG